MIQGRSFALRKMKISAENVNGKNISITTVFREINE